VIGEVEISEREGHAGLLAQFAQRAGDEASVLLLVGARPPRIASVEAARIRQRRTGVKIVRLKPATREDVHAGSERHRENPMHHEGLEMTLLIAQEHDR
jgi:hypothetical protein